MHSGVEVIAKGEMELGIRQMGDVRGFDEEARTVPSKFVRRFGLSVV